MRYAPVLLFAAIPLLAAQTPAPQVPVRQVVLTSHQYAPAVLILRADTPVPLTFVNKAGKAHDFTARRFFASTRILSGDVEGGQIDLKAAESRSVTLIPARGEYPVHCSKFLHKRLGMRGRIIVE